MVRRGVAGLGISRRNLDMDAFLVGIGASLKTSRGLPNLANSERVAINLATGDYCCLEGVDAHEQPSKASVGP